MIRIYNLIDFRETINILQTLPQAHFNLPQSSKASISICTTALLAIHTIGVICHEFLTGGHNLFQVREKHPTLLLDSYFESYGNCILNLFPRSVMSLEVYS
jgi:hypothetical protein